LEKKTTLGEGGANMRRGEEIKALKNCPQFVGETVRAAGKAAVSFWIKTLLVSN